MPTSQRPDKNPDKAVDKAAGTTSGSTSDRPPAGPAPSAGSGAKPGQGTAKPGQGSGGSGAKPGQGSGAKPGQGAGAKAPRQGAGRPAGAKGSQGPGARGSQAKRPSGAQASARGAQASARGAQGRPAARQGGASRPGRHRLSATERAAAKRRRLIRNLTITVVVVVVVGGIAGLMVARNASEQAAVRDLHIQSFANLGQDHLDPGGKFTQYNSTPPTSGPHDPTPAPCGVTTEPIANEVQVHDLEHGVVVIQYRPDLAQDQVSQLAAFANSYPSHMIVAPYPGLTTSIAATAWTKLMTLDSPDTSKLRRFVELYRQKGPETIACPMSQQ